MNIYRKIYEHNFGPIPKDENGRSFEIHHIDGNNLNNKIDNLKAVSIQEHYDIHFKQEDWWACTQIACRMKSSPEHIIMLASKNSQKRIKNDAYHFLSGEIQKKSAKKRISEGTFNLLDSKSSSIIQKRRIKEGKFHFQNPIEYVCPHCNKTGKGYTMLR